MFFFYSLLLASTGNDIDGEAFILLEDADILSLVSIGAARKLISKRKMLAEVSTQENKIFTVITNEYLTLARFSLETDCHNFIIGWG